MREIGMFRFVKYSQVYLKRNITFRNNVSRVM